MEISPGVGENIVRETILVPCFILVKRGVVGFWVIDSSKNEPQTIVSGLYDFTETLIYINVPVKVLNPELYITSPLSSPTYRMP